MTDLPTFVAPIDVARATFLALVIPQLRAGGFDHLAASYAVELARLEARRDAS